MTPAMLHKMLLRKIRENSRHTDFDVAHYVGTRHTMYNLPTPILHMLAKRFRQEHEDISLKMCIDLTNRLFHASSYEEKVLASMILGEFPLFLAAVPASYIDRWMGLLTGWAEVDTTCDEVDIWLRADPKRGISLITSWNTSTYLEKRRASLVVLCSSVRHDPDALWKQLGFQFVDTLTYEKHIMITKAVSWLLRAMIKFHRRDVELYLEKHRNTLPKIAVREVEKKLTTGKKN